MIREVPIGARWQAAERVAAWGYPRPVSPREVELGTWFEDGGRICWFVTPVRTEWDWRSDAPQPGHGGVLAVHGIADPDLRRRERVLTSRRAVEMETIAQLLGARKLYSLIPRETPNMPVAAMRRYLRRFGWLEDEFGSYKLLGGE